MGQSHLLRYDQLLDNCTCGDRADAHGGVTSERTSYDQNYTNEQMTPGTTGNLCQVFS